MDVIDMRRVSGSNKKGEDGPTVRLFLNGVEVLREPIAGRSDVKPAIERATVKAKERFGVTLYPSGRNNWSSLQSNKVAEMPTKEEKPAEEQEELAVAARSGPMDRLSLFHRLTKRS